MLYNEVHTCMILSCSDIAVLAFSSSRLSFSRGAFNSFKVRPVVIPHPEASLSQLGSTTNICACAVLRLNDQIKILKLGVVGVQFLSCPVVNVEWHVVQT